MTTTTETPSSATPEPIRVLLADDHIMVHIGIAGMLEAAVDLELVGEAMDGREALEVCAAVNPDVILMDLEMTEINGIAAIQEIRRRWPQICIIALTNHDDRASVSRALDAGAGGYLLKNVTAHELAAAIRATYCGRVTLAPEVAQTLIHQEAVPLLSPLTERERETLTLLAKGHSNNQIAEQLAVSPFTVKNHVRSILQKLNAANRAEAAILAVKYNLVAIA
ncbi:MAG: response regulator transcription factor [Caldilineaceae bacterium]|nr:response regulator transcription factor [Caldilineaceae bacterium]